MATEEVPQPKARGTRRRAAAFVIAAVIVALGAGAWSLTHEPQLIDHAARVSNVTSYAWINDHELLWAMPRSAHLARIDLRTHDQRLLDAANATADAKTWTDMRLRSVAPGGNRSLSMVTVPLPDKYIGDPYPRNILAELNGGARDTDTGISPVWFPDGRRWIALGSAERNWYRDEEPPQGIWLYSADAPNQRVGPLPAPKSVKQLLGVAPDYRLVMTDLPIGIDQPSVTVWQRGIYPNDAAERQAILTAPSGWFFRAAALSPSGNRIAWLLTSQRIPPLLAFVGRLLPTFVKNVSPSRTYQIRTTTLDGRDAREIGFQTAGTANLGSISDLKWNPDGKRVSFVYGDNLYIVPAN